VDCVFWQIIFACQRFERDSNGGFDDMHFGPLVVHSPANFYGFRREGTKSSLPERFDSSIVIFGGVFWRAARKRLENCRAGNCTVSSNLTPSAITKSQTFLRWWIEAVKRRFPPRSST